MKENTIKPIETLYNGMRFRSRLEARWAVFFDAIGMKYEYEPEGYALKDGTAYLPDFYLPSEDMFVEVKPEREGAVKELEKVEQFVEDTKNIVLILPTIPDRRDPDFWWFAAIYKHPLTRMIQQRRICFWKYGESDAFTGSHYYVCNLAERLFRHKDKNELRLRLPLIPINDMDMPYRKEENEDEIIRLSDIPGGWEDVSKALDKARSARFEHGEKPKA